MNLITLSHCAWNWTRLDHTLALSVAMLGVCDLEAAPSPPQYLVYKDSQGEPKDSITTWSATNSGETVVFTFHNNTTGSNWVVNLLLSEGEKSQANEPSEREPQGSHNIFWSSPGTAGAFNPNIDFYLHNTVSGSNWVSTTARYKGITLPYILKDTSSRITYEVATDGRHVSATDEYGALLWYRDPFADAHLEYYRTDKPCIVAFDIHQRCDSENWDFPERVLRKKGIKAFISVRFNSSQTGCLDVTSGDFFFTGQR